MAKSLNAVSDAGVVICEALGLEPNHVRGLTINFKGSHELTIVADVYPTDEALAKIAGAISKLRFIHEEIEETVEVTDG